MNICLLLGQSESVYVTEQGIQPSSSRFEGDVPGLIAPALTLRKHFQIPSNLDKDVRSVRMEVFSRFVPGSLDDFHCQFVSNPLPDEEKTSLLGLAVKKQEIAKFKEQDLISGRIYIFERLLADRSFPERTFLRVPLPQGTYFAVSERTILWSRYLKNPTDESRERTVQYINREFPEITRRRQLPEFPGSQDDSSSWSRAILDLLPESPDKEWNLLSRRKTGSFEKIGWRAWSLLTVLILVLGAWLGTNLYEQKKYQEWIERSFREQFDRPPRYPIDELQAKVKRARGAQRTSKNAVTYKYPRLVELDSALSQHNLKVLRISLVNNAGSMVFLSPALETAEALVEELRTNNQIESVQIQNTDSHSQGPYQYEVDMDIQWAL